MSELQRDRAAERKATKRLRGNVRAEKRQSGNAPELQSAHVTDRQSEERPRGGTPRRQSAGAEERQSYGVPSDRAPER